MSHALLVARLAVSVWFLCVISPSATAALSPAIYNHCVGFNCSAVHDAGPSSFATTTSTYSVNSYTTLNTTGPAVGAYVSYSESIPGALGTLYGPNYPGYSYSSYSSISFEFEILSSVANKPVNVSFAAQGNASARDSGASVGSAYAYFAIDPAILANNLPTVVGATACVAANTSYCSLYFPNDFAGTSFIINNTVQLLTDVIYEVVMTAEASFYSSGLDNGVASAFVDPSICINADPTETLIFSSGVNVQGPAAVPEPTSSALFCLGVLGLIIATRRRKPR